MTRTPPKRAAWIRLILLPLWPWAKCSCLTRPLHAHETTCPLRRRMPQKAGPS